jgi:hypothetical protein
MVKVRNETEDKYAESVDSSCNSGLNAKFFQSVRL